MERRVNVILKELDRKDVLVRVIQKRLIYCARSEM